MLCSHSAQSHPWIWNDPDHAGACFIGGDVADLWLYSDAGAAACGKYLWAILLVLYIAMIWFLTAVLCKNQSSPKKLMRGILCFPLFILIWLVLMPVNLFRRKLIWKPIPHEFASKIEEMH